MKNLLKSVSGGNPAKFVWQNFKPGQNPSNIEDIKNNIVSSKELQDLPKHIDTTKTTLAKIQNKFKELAVGKKKILEKYEQTKDSMQVSRFNTYLTKQKAAETVNQKMMTLTSDQERALMSEHNIKKELGKTNRELLKPVLIAEEEDKLAQADYDKWAKNMDEIAQKEINNLRNPDGESYLDLAMAENTLQRQQKEHESRYKELLALQEVLNKNDINDPEYAKMITESRTDMLKSQNREALAAQEDADKIQIPFTLADIGGSPWEMIGGFKNMPGKSKGISKSLRKKFAVESGLIPDYTGTTKQNEVLYKYLKDNLS